MNFNYYKDKLYLFFFISIILIVFMFITKQNIKIYFYEDEIIKKEFYLRTDATKIMVPSSCEVFIDKQKLKDFKIKQNWKIYNYNFNDYIKEVMVICKGKMVKGIQIYTLKKEGDCNPYFLKIDVSREYIVNLLKELKYKTGESYNINQQIIGDDLFEVISTKKGSCGGQVLLLHDLLCSLGIPSNISVGFLKKGSDYIYHSVLKYEDLYLDYSNKNFYIINNFIPMYTLNPEFLNKGFYYEGEYWISVNPIFFLNSNYKIYKK